MAATTTPMPPMPSTFSTRYLPARTSPCRTGTSGGFIGEGLVPTSGVRGGDARSWGSTASNADRLTFRSPPQSIGQGLRSGRFEGASRGSEAPGRRLRVRRRRAAEAGEPGQEGRRDERDEGGDPGGGAPRAGAQGEAPPLQPQPRQL